MDKKINQNQQSDEKLRPLIIAFILIIIIWIFSYILIALLINNSENRGTFGDSFGAINSLFSGLALAGIIYTIILQRKELALQRMELIETRNELKRAADAQEKSEKALVEQIRSMKLTAKLNALNSLVEYYSKSGNPLSRDKKKMFAKEIENTLSSIAIDSKD